MKYELGIVIPTYNEMNNLKDLFEQIHQVVVQHTLNVTVLIVDDGSPDGTGDKVEEYISANIFPHLNLQLMRRAGKQGLASAYIQGFSAIMDQCEYVQSMDADLSHSPKYLPSLLAAARQGAHCVIGSRYTKGGGVDGWDPVRLAISRFASIGSQIILFSPIKDQTGGFNLYQVGALKQINLNQIKSQGYAFQVEMKYSFTKKKLKVVEVPIIFVDRVEGVSKFNKKIILEAMIRIPLIRLGL